MDYKNIQVKPAVGIDKKGSVWVNAGGIQRLKKAGRTLFVQDVVNLIGDEFLNNNRN